MTEEESPHILRGRSADRPRESAARRLRWIFPECMINSGMDVIRVDAVDYRGQKVGAVVSDVLREAKVIP